MKTAGIRSRVLLAVLLPVTLMAVALSGVFLVQRMADIEKAHNLQTQTLIRQLAVACEYGLFSGNTFQLQTLVHGVLKEPNIRSVAVVDERGRVLASFGNPIHNKLPTLNLYPRTFVDEAARTEVLMAPVFASQVALDDLFKQNSATLQDPPMLLGHVLIEFSTQALLSREWEVLLLGLAALGLGLFLSGILALRLGQRVINPILQVSTLIKRLGQGDYSARGRVLPNDPLRDLHQVLNQTAERLASAREDLEQRIALATAALREKKEEAEKATLAKSRFLAVASHDLRQPTHALGLFVTRLAQLPHDEQTSLVIKNLERSVRAMQDLLDGLMDISRLDAQAAPVPLTSFALNGIFEQLRDGFSEEAQTRHLRLHIRPTDVWVQSDPALLYRVVMNLMSNALRYTQTGGVLLACRLCDAGQKVRIEVWDTGIGIAPEHQQAIFSEFYQVNNDERNRGKGLGLGLNIVQRTAQLLGHTVHLCSQPGQGTRFSLELARAKPEPLVTVDFSADDPVDKALRDVQVLVIEDDALAMSGLSGLLTSWGATVYEADCLAGALLHLDTVPVPDLIISDYRLPGGAHGMEVIRQIRAAVGAPVPACLISGDADTALLARAQEAQLTLLQKPVRPAKLRSLIRRLLREAVI